MNEKFGVIAENETAFAVLNNFPLTEGQSMVLPKKCLKDLSKFSEREVKDFFELADKISKLIEKVYGEGTIMNINRKCHSSIPHIHMHVLNTKGNLRDHISLHENVLRRKEISDEELSIISEKLRGS